MFFRAICRLSLLVLAGCGGGGGTPPAPPVAPPPVAEVIKPTPVTPVPVLPLTMLHTQGAKWLKADGSPVTLKGVNLGNWLINEFWMMGQGSNGIDDQCKLEAKLDERFGYAERQRLMQLFRDNWITTRDWDQMQKFGLNVVRLPFIYSVVEDEKNPRTLRADAWRYLDDAIAQAEKRGMYVILDLHGAVGSQGWEQHSGCAGKNLYWSTPEFQQRTIWLWQQVAGRYKDRVSVAGYSVLNEPWGTDAANLASVVKTLYSAIRAVDPNHVVILPGHNSGGINAYGKPSGQGMSNVAFEMHFYPGLFGWGQIGVQVHKDWLTCSGGGNSGVCEWDNRIRDVDTAFFVGEMQPWTGQGLDMGGQIARASFDTYAKYGWAATAWSWKVVTNSGGQGNGTWGMVTNAGSAPVPKTDFTAASLSEIETLFKSFGSQQYEVHQPLQDWMTSSTAPQPFR
ncbi:glycoside hydrolase family 5 protein [Duganella radicis]|uniref:Cellulase family glycosylhydrolase n=1 Tax=Duganella radicis TaxID=551988 RepID=A0A6L6PIV8_9BURK|nr:cellulase family glycosylhydrolase [Duganella radicis]MTV38943.1 cellulase family glycosylhydrolase [Duganella radicis]